MRQTLAIAIAAGLALAGSASTWAGKSGDEKPVRGSSRPSVQGRMNAGASGQRPSGVVVSRNGPMATRSSATSPEVKPFTRGRWLQEREGYRDGGY